MRTKSTLLIDQQWLNHIAAEADDDGIWLSTPDTRAALPHASLWSDRYIHRRLQRLARAGDLRRVARSRYSVR